MPNFPRYVCGMLNEAPAVFDMVKHLVAPLPRGCRREEPPDSEPKITTDQGEAITLSWRPIKEGDLISGKWPGA